MCYSGAVLYSRRPLACLLAAVVALLLVASSGCIVPVAGRRIAGPLGAPPQPNVNPDWIEKGKTSRTEIEQKLQWANSGLRSRHFFLARWLTSGRKYAWVIAAGYNAAGGTFRNWKSANLLVEFDDDNKVRAVALLSDKQLLDAFFRLAAATPDEPLDLREPLVVRLVAPAGGGPTSDFPVALPGSDETLVLSKDDIIYATVRRRKPLNTALTVRELKGIEYASVQPNLASIGVRLMFANKTPQGMRPKRAISIEQVYALTKYLQQVRTAP